MGQNPDLSWIVDVAKEIVTESGLCESCTWVAPSITKRKIDGESFYFLRYNCSINESFSRMYDENGKVVQECILQDRFSTCEVGFDAFTIFTSTEDISPIWSCDKGFECAFVVENNVEQDLPIHIDNSRCAEGIKRLTLMRDFFSYQWRGDSISGTDSSLEIIKGGDYFVTVTDASGCELKATVYIPNFTAFTVQIKGAKEICPTGSTILTAADFDAYQWSTGSTTKEIEVAPGRYHVSVTDEQACEGTASFIVGAYPPLPINVTADKTTLTEGESLNAMLINSATMPSISEIEWTGIGIIDCTDCEVIQFTPQIRGELQVNIIDDRGCKATASVFINLKELPLEVYAPNAFRPSSFDENALFTIYGGYNVREISELAIFDRWGNQVFHKLSFAPNQPRSGWDGQMNDQELRQDVYIYWAKVLFFNGKEKIFSGDVILLR